MNLIKHIFQVMLVFVILDSCADRQTEHKNQTEFRENFLSKFTPMPSDSVLLYNDFLNYKDNIFFGGKAMSAEEKKLIPIENKDSINPDSGIFLACYSFKIDSLYTGLIISHPNRYFPREYYFYLYNKDINLTTNNRDLLALDLSHKSSKYLVVKRNKSGIPVSISVQNNYFENINHPDSLTGGGRFEYIFNVSIMK